MTHDESLQADLERAFSPSGDCPAAAVRVFRVVVAQPAGRERADMICAVAWVLASSKLPEKAERLRKVAEREAPTAPRLAALTATIV